MTKMFSTAIVAALALTASLTAANAKSSCVLAGGEATMITEDLAKFMANAAMNNSIKGMNATPSGKAVMKCKPATGLTYCISQQRACK